MSGVGLTLAQLAMATQVFAQAPLSDTELADLRGGIRLPNGIEAALTIETLTAVNGAIVLMTVVKVDTGPPQVTVFARMEGPPVATQQDGLTGTPQSLPTISFDDRNGLHVVRGVERPAITVAVGIPPANSGVPGGLVQIDAGEPVQSADGRITSSWRGGIPSVELVMPDLQVLHLTGQAYGSAVVNSASDLAIDTQTTVSLDLRNAGPDVLGSTMLRVADVATDAMSTRF